PSAGQRGAVRVHEGIRAQRATPPRAVAPSPLERGPNGGAPTPAAETQHPGNPAPRKNTKGALGGGAGAPFEDTARRRGPDGRWLGPQDGAVALLDLPARAAGARVVPADLGSSGPGRRALGGLAAQLTEALTGGGGHLFLARVARHRRVELGLVPLLGLGLERLDGAAALRLELHELGEHVR